MDYGTALKKSNDYFNGDDLAAQVFLGKYALTTPEGSILEPTPDEMHRRLAKEFARIEAKYPNPLSEEEIYQYFKNFKYIIPQGSPMAGVGNPYQIVSLSNCFVIQSPYDSYGGILKTDQEEAQLMKRRGGVGFDISTIRPRGLNTSNAAKTTDGIGVFMERFSNTCREVAQGGRRGALMLTISVHHPEIETFIKIKHNLKKVTGANISIRLTDEFMNAVKNDTEVELRFPVDSSNPSIRKNIKAKILWDEIIKSAHGFAEPGLIFWDTVKKWSPADAYQEFQTVSTNPCGEITLSPYDSCRLLLVNALSFVENPFTESATFNEKLFISTCRVAQRLMDDIIDLELECIDKIIAKINADNEPDDVKKIEFDLWNRIRSTCQRGRRTGLGLTAIGDTLASLGQCYGSNESVQTVDMIYSRMALGAYTETVNLAKERGAFPAFDYELEKEHPFLNRIFSLDKELAKDWKQYGRRNIALTTTAPAGSVSVVTQTTSGIEPAFEVVYKRRKKINPNDKEARVDFVDDLGDKWQEYEVYHHQYRKWMQVSGKSKVEESPYWKARANDIDWVAKVKVQAAAQKWICHSISNTTNVPKETPVDVIKDIYMAGWESGCKGVTVYRDGSRSGVLLTEESKKTDKKAESFADHHAPRRPKQLPCDVVNLTVNGEKWTVFVGMLEGRPYEVIGGLTKHISMPKRVKNGKIIKHNGEENPVARYDFHYDYEKGPEDECIIKDIANNFNNTTHSAFTRTISLALRHGAPVQFIVEQLIKGSEKEDDLFSFSRAMSRVLKTYIKDGTKSSEKKCTSCGSNSLIYQEGCSVCTSCGMSKCN